MTDYSLAARPLELIFSGAAASNTPDKVGGILREFAGCFLEGTYPAQIDRAFVHEVRYSECLAQILAMRKLESDWNSYGADRPSDRALRNAMDALSALKEQGLLPARIRPTADESIMFELHQNGTRHLMEFFSDGDIVFLEEIDGKEDAHDLAVEQMHEFISRLGGRP